jgi:hypothetical protein
VRRRPSDVPPAERARWLAELAEAIDQAQKVAWRIGVAEGDNAEAKELYGRLEAARVEVDALRRGSFRAAPHKTDPDWLKQLLWDCQAVSSAS